jgi:hypothetical protein
MGQAMSERMSPDLIAYLMRPSVGHHRKKIVSHRRQQPAGASGPVFRVLMTPAEVEARSTQLEAERLARR